MSLEYSLYCTSPIPHNKIITNRTITTTTGATIAAMGTSLELDDALREGSTEELTMEEEEDVMIIIEASEDDGGIERRLERGGGDDVVMVTVVVTC